MTFADIENGIFLQEEEDDSEGSSEEFIDEEMSNQSFDIKEN
jgi:hypothetical protein